MEFRPNPLKTHVKTRFVEGSVSTYTGTELQVAVGTVQPLNRRKFVLLMRKVVSLAKQYRLPALALSYKDLRALAEQPQQGSDGPQLGHFGMDDFTLGQVAGTSFVMADYEHNTYKTPPKDGFFKVTSIAITGTPKDAKDGFARGHQIATVVNECRELSNTPGKDMTPRKLLEAAQRAVRGTRAKVDVLDRAEMQKLGMGAVLAIAQGSVEEPQFIVVEYWGADETEKPIVLVGKGVTFDTGGLNIKPGDHMYEMHMDMSGGAAVIEAVALAAKLKLKKNVIALVPAVENSPSGHAIRPGDIVKSLSGKTIEILNTDAEGRVILADGITYAKRYNPAAIVDVATLTGAALVALGQQASAFMTNEKGFNVADIMHVAEKSGDYMWPFPAWAEYEEMTKGTFGDVPNLSTAGNSRYGGVIAGGMFLKRFADDIDCLWIHIDMAPRMTATSSEFLAKGAVGAPVRFLLQFVEEFVPKA
jgi:leucyl aminopeptidase